MLSLLSGLEVLPILKTSTDRETPLTGVCLRGKKLLGDSSVSGNLSVIQEKEQRERFWFFITWLSVLICYSNMVAEGKIPMLIVGFLLPFVWLSTQEFMSSLDFSAAVWKLIDSKPPLYSSFTHCMYSCKERACHFQIRLSKHFANAKGKNEINRYEQYAY